MKRALIVFLISVTLVGFVVGSVVGCAPTRVDRTPRIAVVSAFGPEMELLKEELELEYTYNGPVAEYYVGELRGKPVVMFLSGISMVNAALTTQHVLDMFNIQAIIFSGIAGGVDPGLRIGDVVVPARWGQYLEAYFAREIAPGTFAPPPWYDPLFQNFGMIFPKPVQVGEEQVFWFEVDAGLFALAQELAQVDLKRCTPDNVCLSHDPVVFVGGNGVSGQVFVDNAAFREYVRSTFQARALDMETAAVAHVAYLNNTPYIAFRSLSDLAGGGPGENEIKTFFKLAADNSAQVVLRYISELDRQAQGTK